MTVAEFSMLLSRLPLACATWPVTVQVRGEDVPVVGLLLLPQHYANDEYPDGCISVAAYITNRQVPVEIGIYRPPADPAAG